MSDATVAELSRLLKFIPDGWGPKFEGPSGEVTWTQTGPNEIRFVALSHMAIVMLSAQPGREVALNNDHKVLGIAPVGAVELVPAGSELFARWVVEAENLLLAMDPQRLTKLAELEFETDRFELQPPKLGFVDDKALLLGRLIREEIQRGGQGNEDCLDSLLTLFGAHLLRNYSSIGSGKSRPFRGGLRASAWRKVKGYIQAHLSEKMSVDAMAQMADLSPSHFIRAFRETTGQPPHQYLLTARITHARRLITTTNLPVSAIAKAAGFHDGSHMAASMQKVWRTSPTRLRRPNGPPSKSDVI
jgi:AraC family transcriptional regulator